MTLLDAKLRLKELTQEIYNIGDEVAEYTEHIAEAVADWDAELVHECLLEFDEIIIDAVNDSRVVAAELSGIRQALTSGVRSGAMGVWHSSPQRPGLPRPTLLDGDVLLSAYPTSSPVTVRSVEEALRGRTELATEHYAAIVDWVLDQTASAARDLRSVSLPTMFTRTRRLVHAVSEGWIDSVARPHPSIVAAQRGYCPPRFLAERARVDAVVEKVRLRLQASDCGA